MVTSAPSDSVPETELCGSAEPLLKLQASELESNGEADEAAPVEQPGTGPIRLHTAGWLEDTPPTPSAVQAPAFGGEVPAPPHLIMTAEEEAALSVPVPAEPSELNNALHQEDRNKADPRVIVAMFEGFMKLHGAPVRGDAVLPKALQPNLVAWKIYVTSLTRSPHGEERGDSVRLLPASGSAGAAHALSIIREMQKRGVPRTRKTYLMAIQQLVYARNIKEAIELLQDAMGEGHMVPEPLGPKQAELDQMARGALGFLVDRAITLGAVDWTMMTIRCLVNMSLLVSNQALQRALVAAVEEHRRDLVAELMMMYDQQTRHQATGARPGKKPMWALDEGTLLKVLDSAAGAGDLATADLVWRHLGIALLPHGHWPKRNARTSAPVVRAKLTEDNDAEEKDELFEELHAPTMSAYHAMIHAHAVAGDLRGAFQWVARLQRAFPGDERAVLTQTSLAVLVDAAAVSPEVADSAYFALEGMRAAGEQVTSAMLDCVVAACAQMSDTVRMLESFEAYPALGLTAGAQAYNVCIGAFIRNNLLDRLPFILEDMQAAGVQWNAGTHALAVEAVLVRRDVPAMLAALEAMKKSGFAPSAALVDRVVQRLEREGATVHLRKFDHRDSERDASTRLSNAKARVGHPL
ncbi:hypothetical protein WJX81_007546 [Elliptochloris bilobata]|uniref:Pentatricopeptide repeat-containing protein-mitochondrial domain-containing protein n=1 Tax=Elliptochloris bilobata TaxID=381761 RepID=A0AAW1R0D1_9CHLO